MTPSSHSPTAESPAERRLAAIHDPDRETLEAEAARLRRERIEWEWDVATLMAESDSTLVDDPTVYLDAADGFDSLAVYFRRFCEMHAPPTTG
ncbi:hypothetical protein [Halopelagius fulvigenes]|uniref:Uncharacterized protein n=1 Tax=Halopelagius fulvigenes TaxID=1198324 RepID=A0ABD5TUL1_9EURY